jgi:peptide/nickel transport system substrate-binding protein
MTRVTRAGWRAARLAPRVTRYMLLIVFLAACARATPSPPAPPTVPSPGHRFSPTDDAHTPSPAFAPTPVSVGPRELTICLADEPQSLYLYARPESGRGHILAALYDGPIDSHNYQYQPVLLTKLPSVSAGDAVINMVTINPGDSVVDALGRVITLTAGVVFALPDGMTLTSSGSSVVSVPQMVVTFHLKPGVLWSDGQPLTADDSVFSYEVSRSPDSYDPRRDLAERTASYRALDAATVEWIGLPGYLDPTYFTNFWTPLPRHLYGSLTTTQIADDEDANRNPLGWGPFVLREWVRGDHLTFDRNPNYFRAAEGLPRLDRVIYRIVLDPMQIVDNLRAGKCDVVPQNPLLEEVVRSLLDGDNVGDLELHVVSGTTLEHLDFEIAAAEDYTPTLGNNFFQDVRARQAFAYCIDRKELAILGEEVPVTYLSDQHPLYTADVTHYPFDPTRGRARLAELGWTDSNGDGILDKSGGQLKLTLAGMPMDDLWHKGMFEEIQAQLKTNCGIEVETRLLTRGELEGDWPDGVIFGRRFDLAMFGWKVGSVPPCELFTTDQIPDDTNPGGANDTGYSDPEFDAACRRALTAFDPQPAAQDHAEAQRLFARDLPVLPLFFLVKIAAARPQVEGFVLDPTSPSELWNIEELALAP